MEVACRLIFKDWETQRHEVKKSEPPTIGDTIRSTFVYQWLLPPFLALLILSTLLPSPLNTAFYTYLHHAHNVAFQSSRGTPYIRSPK